MISTCTIDPLDLYEAQRAKLSEHDTEIFVKAMRTGWEWMSELADQCESEWARNRIRAVMRDRYHREND